MHAINQKLIEMLHYHTGCATFCLSLFLSYLIDDLNEPIGEEGQLDEDLVVLRAVLELQPRHALHQLPEGRLAHLAPVLHTVGRQHAPRLGAALRVVEAGK